MPSRQKREQRTRWLNKIWAVIVLLSCASIALFLLEHNSARRLGVGQGDAEAPDSTVFAAYGKSPSCISCHEDAYKLWRGSHHALAERSVNPALDSPAFQPIHKIRHGSQTSEARFEKGQFQLVTRGLGGEQQP